MNFVEKFDSGSFGAPRAFSGAGESFSVDVHARGHSLGSGGPDAVVVPDAELLFSGDYKRSGLDLVLSKNGHEFVARDYFRGDNRAALASPDGASLSGDTVEALTGQVDYAQAGGNIAPAKIIGQVTKLTGSATAIRNGVSITLNMGDNVHKGDVVQSGSDSSLGITFMDGTVFGLSSNARMVLNEMIYNPTGSNNASLLTLVQGTISFVAGATAKTGDMKVETPTATMGIRGTAVLVEIDFDIYQPGLAPPVSFRILVEPNGETGEYVLYDKQTQQPIATVNQAGTKTVVNGLGVVTFFPSADIPANAQRLINDIFSIKFTDANPKYIGIPPLDTITPQSFQPKLPDGTPMDQVQIIRIVLVLEPLTPAPPSGGNNRFYINLPPDLLASSGQFTERLLTTGNTALDTVSGGIHFDAINPGDRPTVTAQFNSFEFRDAQQETIVTSSLTLEQLAAIQAVQKPLTVVPDAGNTNVGDATWTYNVQDKALDFLAEGETLTLIYMARVDTNYSEYNTVVFKPFKITITGTNDLPTVAATGSGIIELDGTNNPEINHAEGVITFADVDLTDRPTVTAPFANYVYTDANGAPLTLTPAQQAALAATLTLTPAQGNTNNGSVAWSYDVADSNFDFIAAGETLVLTYHATVDDGHGGIVVVPLTLTVSVQGTNDIPTITATSDGFVELVGTTHSASSDHAGGTITFTDVDLTDRPAISAPFSGYSYTAANGTTPLILTAAQLNALAIALTLDPSPTNANNGSVTWSYDLADNQFDFLAVGETLVLTYTATVDDGQGGVVTTPITVTVTGTNDAPAISAIAQENLVEQTDTSALTATIAVTFTDVDLTDVGHTAQVTQAVASGVTTGLALSPADLIGLIDVGTVIKNAGSSAGSLSLGFAAASTAFDYLADGEVLTLTYTVAIDDHDGGTTPQTFVVTITGSNDAPVVATADLAGAVTEDVTPAGNLTDTGTIAFTDVDLTDTHVISPNIVASSGALGVLTASVTTDTTGSGLGGVVSWTYSVPASAVEYLADDEIKVEQFTITLDDGNGGTIDRIIEVAITGTNDVPVISAIAQEDLVEQTDTSALTATIAVTFTDVDLTDVGHTAQVTQAVAGGVTTGLALSPADLIGLIDVGTVTKNAGSSAGSLSLGFAAGSTAFDYLADGEVLTLTYTVAIDDHDGGTTPQTFVVTITGSNDAPVVATADLAGTVTEDVTPAGNLTDTGTIAFTDVDLTDTHLISPNIVASSGALGVLSASVTTDTTGSGLGGVVSWTYSVPASAVEYLADDEIKVEQFTLTLDDGNGGAIARVVEVTITGTNDVPIIAATNDGFTELAGTGNATLGHAGGTITFTDVDLTDRPTVSSHFTSFTYQDALHTELTLSLTAQQQAAIDAVQALLTLTPNGANANNGSVVWSYDLADSSFDFLADGETLALTYTATVDDGDGGNVSTPITVTVHGTNDAPTIAATNDGFTELAGTGNATLAHAGGTITFTDVDLTDRPTVSSHFTSFTYQDALQTDLIASLTAQQQASIAAVQALLALTPDGANANNGSVAWSYDLADSSFDFLADGETLALTYTATVDDGLGGSVSTPITVTITGSNDAPAITSAAQTGSVTEAENNSADELNNVTHQATGALAFTDVDLADTHSVSVTGNATPGYRGTLSAGIADASTGDGAGSVGWTFAVADGALDDLAATDVLTQTYTVTVDDGHGGTSTQTITITINGAADNQAPVVTGAVALAPIAEDSGARLITQAELLVNTTDPDGPGLTATNLAITAGNGALVDNGNGTWSYTPALNDDADVSFSYQVTDGVAAPVATSATLDITPIDDAPVAVVDTVSTAEDTATVGLGATLKANDDPDGGPAPTIVSVGNAQHGTVVLNGGNPIFTPDADFTGQASFTYWITDAASPPAAGTLQTPTSTPVGAGAFAVATGDLNGDGDLDLVVTNNTGANLSILLGNGDGTFGAQTTFATGVHPFAVTIGDLDGDNDADIVVANLGNHTISVLLGDGTGSFAAQQTYAVGTHPEGVQLGDFNGDGDLDVVATGASGTTLSLLLGNGDGTFAAATGFATAGLVVDVAVGDFNGDGDLDVVTTNYNTNTASVLLGNGLGGFGAYSAIAVGGYPLGMLAADFDADGNLDFATVNNSSNDISVLLGNGNGTFQPQVNYATGSAPANIASADFDQDGILDLVVANGSTTVSVFSGNGDGTFDAAVSYAAATTPGRVATGDLNGDGLVDVIVADSTSNNVNVLLNAAPGGAISSATVTVNVTGTNDAPVIIGPIAQQDLDVPDSPSQLAAIIPVAFNDVDLQDSHTAQITHVSASGTLGGFFAAEDDPVLMALMSTGGVFEPSGSSPGSLDLNFAANSTVFDYLEGTEVVTLAYTFEIEDQHGAIATQTAIVAIHNDFIIGA